MRRRLDYKWAKVRVSKEILVAVRVRQTESLHRDQIADSVGFGDIPTTQVRVDERGRLAWPSPGWSVLRTGVQAVGRLSFLLPPMVESAFKQFEARLATNLLPSACSEEICCSIFSACAFLARPFLLGFLPPPCFKMPLRYAATCSYRYLWNPLKTLPMSSGRPRSATASAMLSWYWRRRSGGSLSWSSSSTPTAT